MPIIAIANPDEPAETAANHIRSLVWGDLWEETKAQLIYEHHSHMDQDMYLLVWELLDSRTRSAWKKYVDEGKRWMLC